MKAGMETRSGTRLNILYRNGKGEVTGRTVRIISVFGGDAGPSYIRAFCELRQEERTFRIDRILAWSVPDTPSSGGVPDTAPRPIPPGDPQQRPKEKTRKKKKWPAVLAAGLLAVCVARFRDNAEPAYAGAAHITSAEELPIETKPAPPPVTAAATAPEAAEEDKPDAYTEQLAERAVRFIESTGISAPEVLTLYASADANRDGGLSWRELEQFQETLFAEFDYADNGWALRPDEFLAAGGGDCEDFALTTAGLVRFWGGLPYIGVFRGGDRMIGHAVCLVYSPDTPEYPVYWTNDGSAFYPGIDLPKGFFVPVDYQYVGSLSSAVSKGWTLAEIMIPEKTYYLPL